MNKDSNQNEQNKLLQDIENNIAVNKISMKSNNIKASLKHRYLINKLERICSKNKFNENAS